MLYNLPVGHGITFCPAIQLGNSKKCVKHCFEECPQLRNNRKNYNIYGNIKKNKQKVNMLGIKNLYVIYFYYSEVSTFFVQHWVKKVVIIYLITKIVIFTAT